MGAGDDNGVERDDVVVTPRAQLEAVVAAALGPMLGTRDTLAGTVVAAVVAAQAVVLVALGMNPVVMSDTECGWVVHPGVEEAGAWSTAPIAL